MQRCSFYSGIYCVCFTLWPIIKLLWHNHKHNMTKDMLLNPTSRAPSELPLQKKMLVSLFYWVIFFHLLFFIYIAKFLLRAMLFFQDRPYWQNKVYNRTNIVHFNLQFKQKTQAQQRKTLAGMCHHAVSYSKLLNENVKTHFMTWSEKHIQDHVPQTQHTGIRAITPTDNNN